MFIGCGRNFDSGRGGWSGVTNWGGSGLTFKREGAPVFQPLKPDYCSTVQ